MRTCKICATIKEDRAFYKTYSYIRYACKDCENRNRNAWRIRRAQEMKEWAVEYLGGKCGQCGYKKCIYALEFNHKRDKMLEPTRMFYKGLGWKRIKKEIDKCELLCANCHREVTYQHIDRTL